MKMERLKSSKFEAFGMNRIDNPLAIQGGHRHATSYRTYVGGVATGGGQDSFDVGETRADFLLNERGDITRYKVGALGTDGPDTSALDVGDIQYQVA